MHNISNISFLYMTGYTLPSVCFKPRPQVAMRCAQARTVGTFPYGVPLYSGRSTPITT